MKIRKVLNNNAVIAQGEDGRDQVVIQMGIGFQKKRGERIEPDQYARIFVLKSLDAEKRFEQIMDEIPSEYIQLAADIHAEAEKKLNTKFSEMLVFSLADHLYTAVMRKRESIEIKNDLLWEIRRFYEAEYKLGIFALDLLKEKTGNQLREDEAGFVAMHILNAEYGSVQSDARDRITKTVQDMMSIVRLHFQIELDPSSIYYYRFVTHLRFFAERMIKGNAYDDDSDTDLYAILSNKYPAAYACVAKIAAYLKKTCDYTLTCEESTYLMVHIQRVIYKSQK